MAAPNPFDQQRPIPGVKRILLVGSGKGGVGKSTVSSNLAIALSQQGLKTGLLDADIYGPSLPRIFGVLNQKPDATPDNRLLPIVRHGVKLMSLGFMVEEGQAVVWRGPMLFKAMNQFLFDVVWADEGDELDVLVVDMPPGTGDVQLTLAQKVPVSGGVIVSTPQNLSLVDAKKAADMFERVSTPVLGLVKNMAYLEQNGEKIKLFPDGQFDQMLGDSSKVEVTELPFYPQMAQAAEVGVPLLVSDENHPANAIFSGLASQLKKDLEL